MLDFFMEVLLDTNFIVSCILKNIDFLGELEEMGFKPVVPREVIQELKDLKTEKKTSHYGAMEIDLALQFFEDSKIKKTRIGGNSVDAGLIEKGKEGIYIATLDREVKRNVPNKVIIDSARKSLKIERD